MARAVLLADGGARQTKPGSMGHQIATTAMTAALAATRGLTVAEHQRAFETAHGPAPETYAEQFGSLVRRGIVVAVAGRPGHMRYAHRDAIVGQGDALIDDDLVVVERALRSACARLHRAVTTREVSVEMAALGLSLRVAHPNAVRQRLGTMAAVRRRGLQEWQPPRVARTTVEGTTRFLQTRWHPIDMPVPVAADVPPNAADAIRTIIGCVEDALRLPVTRDDCVLWIAAHPAHPAVMALGVGSVSELLPSVAKHDAKASGRSRVMKRAPDRGRSGLAPMAYHLIDDRRTPDHNGVLAHRLGEALDGLQPVAELAEIALLRKRAARLRVAALDTLADARIEALRYAMDAVVRDAGDEAGAAGRAERGLRETAIDALRHAIAVRAAWASVSTPHDAGARRLLARDRERAFALDAQRPLLANDEHAEGAPVAVVGAGSAAGLEELAPFIASAARDLGWRVNVAATYRVLNGCRRFDGAAPQARYARTRTNGPRLAVDRADAMLALFTKNASPRVTVLLTSARELLGRVVRDSPLLAHIAEQCRPVEGVLAGDPGTWRGAVVALGLLGITPTADDIAVTVAGDRLTGAAVGLAAVLALGEGSDAVFRAQMAAGGAVATSAATAARRVRDGRLTAAVS